MIQYKLFQIGGIQTRDKCIYKFLTENEKFQVIISHPIHFDKEIDDENFISLGDGDYMAPVPHKDNMIIKTTSDKSKAFFS